MISAHTPPGTPVVCIRGLFRNPLDNLDEIVLTVGATYTIAEWFEASGRFFVALVGVPDLWFSRVAFDPVSLPDCLTRFVNTVPTDRVRDLEKARG